MSNNTFNPENRVSWLELAPSLQELFRILQSQMEFIIMNNDAETIKNDARFARIWGDISLDDNEHTIRDIWRLLIAMQKVYDNAEDGQVLTVDKYFDKNAPFVKAVDSLQYMGVVNNPISNYSFRNGNYNMKYVAKYWNRIWLDAYSKQFNDKRFGSEGYTASNGYYYDETENLLVNENNNKSIIALLSNKKIYKKSKNINTNEIILEPEYTIEIEFDGTKLTKLNTYQNKEIIDDNNEQGFIIATFQDSSGVMHDISVVRRSNENGLWNGRQFSLVYDRLNPNSYYASFSTKSNSKFKEYWNKLSKIDSSAIKYYPYNNTNSDSISIHDFSNVSNVYLKTMQCPDSTWLGHKCRIKVIKTKDSITAYTTDFKDEDYVFTDNDYIYNLEYTRAEAESLTNSNNIKKQNLLKMFNEPSYIGLFAFNSFLTARILTGNLYNISYLLDVSTNRVYVYYANTWNIKGLIDEVIEPKVFIQDVYSNRLYFYPGRGEGLVQILTENKAENNFELLETYYYLKSLLEKAKNGQVLKIDRDKHHNRLPYLTIADEIFNAVVINSNKNENDFKSGSYNMEQVARYWDKLTLDGFTNIQNETRAMTDSYINSHKYEYDAKNNMVTNKVSSFSILGLLSNKKIYKKEYTSINEYEINPEYEIEIEFDGSKIEMADNIDDDGEWGFIIGAYQDENKKWNDLTVVRRGNLISNKYGNDLFNLVINRFDPDNYKDTDKLFNYDAEFKKVWDLLMTSYGVSDKLYSAFAEYMGIRIDNIINNYKSKQYENILLSDIGCSIVIDAILNKINDPYDVIEAFYGITNKIITIDNLNEYINYKKV